MADTKEKTDFSWENGEVLNPKNFSPLGGVRSKGLPKLKKAVAADPILRKEERESFINNEQTKVYKSVKHVPIEDDALIIEESQSGLTGDIENSEAKKLIDPGDKVRGKIRGLDRFGKK